MKGFIVPRVISNFQQTLQLLERAVGTGWDGGQAVFYRFGARIEPIKGRGYLVAAEPQFYEDAEMYKRTFIENVISSANMENLTVVVTDLFQNAADVSLLTSALKDKYLANNLAVGVLGIKSQFEGTVYDVGIRNYSFPYSSGESKPEQFRPFYVLMLGRHADIERYYDALKAIGVVSFPHNFIILSKYITHPPASFENGKVTSAEKVVEVRGLLSPSLKDERVKQFRLRSNSDTASLVITLKNFPLPYTMPFGTSTLEPEIEAWKCQSAQLVASEPAGRAFTINSSSVAEKELSLEAKIAAAALPGEGIYCFKVTLRPKEFILPAWISEWDMPIELVERWKDSPANFNGATTFNLKPFLYDLYKTTIQLHGPKLGEIYCYIQKG